jgi:hypothetical protein
MVKRHRKPEVEVRRAVLLPNSNEDQVLSLISKPIISRFQAHTKKSWPVQWIHRADIQISIPAHFYILCNTQMWQSGGSRQVRVQHQTGQIELILVEEVRSLNLYVHFFFQILDWFYLNCRSFNFIFGHIVFKSFQITLTF